MARARGALFALHALLVTTCVHISSRTTKSGEISDMFSRRAAIGLMATGMSSLLVSARRAAAADYPTRPIRFLVAYPPGGATDIIARLIGQRLSERLDQQFVIEKQAGRRQQYRHRGCGERRAR